MLLTYKLKIIDQLLTKEGIPYISFKGPILSMLSYGDIVSRRYLDLDILVNQKDLEIVYNILENNGYKSDIKVEYTKDERFLDISKDILFFNKKENINIEVHWKLFEKRFFFQNFSLNELSWNNLSQVKINNFTIPTFNKEYLIFYLIIHGSKHFWERIEWLYNIFVILKNEDNINLKNVIAYAESMQAKTMVKVFFNLLEISFNYNVDKKILILDNRSQLIAEDIISYWSNTQRGHDKINMTEIKFMIAFQDSFLNKLKVIFKTIFQIKVYDILYLNLPKKLTFLYYFTRPLRVMIDHLKK